MQSQFCIFISPNKIYPSPLLRASFRRMCRNHPLCAPICLSISSHCVHAATSLCYLQFGWYSKYLSMTKVSVMTLTKLQGLRVSKETMEMKSSCLIQVSFLTDLLRVGSRAGKSRSGRSPSFFRLKVFSNKVNVKQWSRSLLKNMLFFVL